MSRDFEIDRDWFDREAAAYEMNGYEIPAGHPDEFLADMERKEWIQRYYDDPEPWRTPVRVSDDWDDLEEAA